MLGYLQQPAKRGLRLSIQLVWRADLVDETDAQRLGWRQHPAAGDHLLRPSRALPELRFQHALVSKLQQGGAVARGRKFGS